MSRRRMEIMQERHARRIEIGRTDALRKRLDAQGVGSDSLLRKRLTWRRHLTAKNVVFFAGFALSMYGAAYFAKKVASVISFRKEKIREERIKENREYAEVQDRMQCAIKALREGKNTEKNSNAS
eukprot:Stramenopile-MAST_4_protein_6380